MTLKQGQVLFLLFFQSKSFRPFWATNFINLTISFY